MHIIIYINYISIHTPYSIDSYTLKRLLLSEDFLYKNESDTSSQPAEFSAYSTWFIDISLHTYTNRQTYYIYYIFLVSVYFCLTKRVAASYSLLHHVPYIILYILLPMIHYYIFTSSFPHSEYSLFVCYFFPPVIIFWVFLVHSIFFGYKRELSSYLSSPYILLPIRDCKQILFFCQ